VAVGVRREWEIRRERGGWFRIRRRARWISAPVAVGGLVLVGAGAGNRLWDEFTMWLWDTTHLAPATVLAGIVIALVLVALGKTNR
jgi:hypothetical protein